MICLHHDVRHWRAHREGGTQNNSSGNQACRVHDEDVEMEGKGGEQWLMIRKFGTSPKCRELKAKDG
jgi:hypothetical protein